MSRKRIIINLDVMQGYPYNNAPVTIHSDVWIASGSTVLPGVSIQSHSVIGNLSLVNKDVPPNSFVGGIPAKVIKSNIYPKKLNEKAQTQIVKTAISAYQEISPVKKIKATISIKPPTTILFSSHGFVTKFNWCTRKITGANTRYSEDFRDFLRHRGIKFFNDKPFTAIKPNWYKKAIKS